MTHTIACALYCNSDGTLNGAGTFVAWAIGGLFGLGAVIWVIRTAVAGVKQAVRPQNRHTVTEAEWQKFLDRTGQR